MSLCRRGIQADCIQAGGIRLIDVAPVTAGIQVKKSAAVGNAGVGASICGIKRDGLEEHAQRELNSFPAVLMEVLLSAEVIVVRLDVLSGRLADFFALFGTD